MNYELLIMYELQPRSTLHSSRLLVREYLCDVDAAVASGSDTDAGSGPITIEHICAVRL